jgi:anti-sigma B factor antagonist
MMEVWRVRDERAEEIMEITTKTLNQVTVVEMSGNLDGTTALMAEEIIKEHAQEGSRLILDLREVGYMSSMGLRLLFLLSRNLADLHGHLALVGLSDDLKETMSITGFLDHFATYDTLEEGVSALQQEQEKEEEE